MVGKFHEDSRGANIIHNIPHAGPIVQEPPFTIRLLAELQIKPLKNHPLDGAVWTPRHDYARLGHGCDVGEAHIRDLSHLQPGTSGSGLKI